MKIENVHLNHKDVIDNLYQYISKGFDFEEMTIPQCYGFGKIYLD
jgi:hypothetical protein